MQHQLRRPHSRGLLKESWKGHTPLPVSGVADKRSQPVLARSLVPNLYSHVQYMEGWVGGCWLELVQRPGATMPCSCPTLAGQD